MGGLCDGGAFVYKTFEEQMHGSCRDCHFLITEEYPHHCQVLEGQDKIIHCPELQEHIRYNEIRLYGENANPDIENPKRRRKRRSMQTCS